MDSVSQVFETSSMPLNDEVFAMADFGDITASQLSEPFDNLSCNICFTAFTLRRNLLRHLRYQHGNNNKKCHICGRQFSRVDTLKEHIKTHENRKRKREGNDEVSHLPPLSSNVSIYCFLI